MRGSDGSTFARPSPWASGLPTGTGSASARTRGVRLPKVSERVWRAVCAARPRVARHPAVMCCRRVVGQRGVDAAGFLAELRASLARPVAVDWARRYCERVGRVSGPVLCAGQRPAGVSRPATPMSCDQPATVMCSRWLRVVATGSSALRRRATRWSGTARGGASAIRECVDARPRGCDEPDQRHPAGHLALTWVQGRWRYVVSTHARPSHTINAAIRAAAEDMGPT